jgi:Fic-DOC domain mobile mystery protein B/predicted DNA-binding mobile mystery protein A
LELRNSHLVREQLDTALAKLGPLGQSKRPIKGWLRAIRTGLGISGVQLAKQLGVKPPRVVEMEKSEVEGAITLKVLERAAEAMGCSLVYALIPRAGSLEQALREQAKAAFSEAGLSSAGVTFSDPASAAAPFAAGETDGLRLSHLATRGDLERWERGNIAEAETWAFTRKRLDPLDVKWMPQLHSRMFGQVWKSAGILRTGDSERGAPASEIRSRLDALRENAAYWAKAAVYPPDEACIRFFHRLAAIRAFDRGSGRHARLMADLLIVRLYGKPRFTWGGGSTASAAAGYKRYLEALRAADARDYGPLLAFARS